MNKTTKIEKVGMGRGGGGTAWQGGKLICFFLLFFHHKCRAASGRKWKTYFFISNFSIINAELLVAGKGKHICFFFFFPSSMQSCLSLIAHHIDPLPSSPHTFYIGSYLLYLLSSSLSS